MDPAAAEGLHLHSQLIEALLKGRLVGLFCYFFFFLSFLNSSCTGERSGMLGWAAALLGGTNGRRWLHTHPCSPVLQLACTSSFLSFLNFQND